MGNLNALLMIGVVGVFYLVHVYINHPYEWLIAGLFAIFLGLLVEDKETEHFISLVKWVFFKPKSEVSKWKQNKSIKK